MIKKIQINDRDGNVYHPETDSDVIKYKDEVLTDEIDDIKASKVNKSGDTMNGNLTMKGDATPLTLERNGSPNLNIRFNNLTNGSRADRYFGTYNGTSLRYGDNANLANGYEIYHTGRKPSQADVGLENVDNTSDLDKPISTATQTALDGKADTSHTHNYAGSSTAGGSATSAAKLATARNIILGDNISGIVSFDGSKDVRLDGFLTRTNITNKTIDLDTITNSDRRLSRRYIQFTIGGCANIANTPVKQPFMLDVDLIRCVSDTDFISKQTLTAANKIVYERYCTNGTWSDWSQVYTSTNKPSKAIIGLGNVDNTSDLDKPISTATQTALDDKLDKTGGTVTGKIMSEGGISTKYFYNGAGKTGYMYIARINITGGYQNQPMKFDVVQRNAYGSITIQFASGGTSDPALSSLKKTGNIDAYMVKAETSTWDLYIKKKEAYDGIDLIRFDKGIYMKDTIITWKEETITTLPSGYTTAGVEYVNMSVASATTDSDGRQINTTYVKKGMTWDELEGV